MLTIKLRSCAQFAPRGKCAPRCLFAPPNLHHLQRWSTFAPGCKSAPVRIFIKHRLSDQNTPQVQIYTQGVHLNRGVYCAYKRGFSLPLFSLTQRKDKSASYSFTTKIMTHSMCQVSLVVKYIRFFSQKVI